MRKPKRAQPERALALALASLVLLQWPGPAHAADAVAGKKVYERCIGCHGADGAGDPQLGAPNLTGQNADYLKRQIESFVRGLRGGSTDEGPGLQMRAGVRFLTNGADVDDVVAYVASLPAKRSSANSAKTQPNDKTGQSYFNGICSACHGSTGAGNAQLHAPRLAGQDLNYLTRQYAHFKSGVRGANPEDVFGTQMKSMVKALPDAATEKAVLTYAAALGATP